jgi:hypothetical protein
MEMVAKLTLKIIAFRWLHNLITKIGAQLSWAVQRSL